MRTRMAVVVWGWGWLKTPGYPIRQYRSPYIFLKYIPLDSELPDRCPNCSQLEIATAPVWQRRDSLCHRVKPLSMGTTPSTR